MKASLHGIGLLAAVAVLLSAQVPRAQEISEDEIAWLRSRGLIEDSSDAATFPDPATPYAVHRVLQDLENEPDPQKAAYAVAFNVGRPDASVRVETQLADLMALVDTVEAYGWVRPAGFARSLRLPLEAAGRHIGRRDSVEAIGALYEFQFRLEEVYSHPEPDVGELTEQGFG